MAKAGRKPDYRLGFLNKDNDERGTVGAGWLNADGSITIKLNVCVVLNANEANMNLCLFKNDWAERKPASASGPSEATKPPF